MSSEEEPFLPSESEYSPSSSSSSNSGNNLFKKRKQAATRNLFDDVPICVAPASTTSNDNFEKRCQKNKNPEENIISDLKKKKVFSKRDKKARKKVSDPDNNWKKRVAAIAREKGESYISQKGKTVPRKAVNEATLCKLKCPKKCSDNVTLEMRKKIFTRFYKLDVNEKNMFLFKSMTARSPKRPQKTATRHRTVSYRYFLEIDKRTIFICKQAFCSIFQIGKKKIEYLQKNNQLTEPAPTPDKRGRHTNRPHKLCDDVRQYIIDHISSFPADLSHYSRNINPHKKYLSPTLNISRMYDLYKEMCNDNQKPAKYFVKYCTYSKIFSTEFNLSFGTPRSDTCATCDSGEGNEEHKANYEAAFLSQREDRNISKSNAEICYITMDLQQTLPLPKLTTSKAFYLRQMWMYNLGIHSINKGQEKANFFTWTEDVAHRGSAEICSSLLTFLEYHIPIQGKGISHLVIWTDSCAGQNKNFLIICLYQYLILKGIVKQIDHKFPEVGHSFLDSDRDFGRIEKNLRKHDTIYLPEEYRTIISKSSKINHVTDMTHHFREFKDLAQDLNLINRKKTLQNKTVPFRDGIKWIRVDEYGSYWYKESYDPNTPFQKVNIIKNARLTPPSHIEIQRIGRKYGKLAPLKIDNLKTQVPFVKDTYRWYYEGIIKDQEENSS